MYGADANTWQYALSYADVQLGRSAGGHSLTTDTDNFTYHVANANKSMSAL